MFSRKISQLIITFAFFYSAVVCHFKAIETYKDENILLSYFLWFVFVTSFAGGLDFK